MEKEQDALEKLGLHKETIDDVLFYFDTKGLLVLSILKAIQCATFVDDTIYHLSFLAAVVKVLEALKEENK